MSLCAGIRPCKQNRSRPSGRASSIQPSPVVRYSRANARISFWSVSTSTPENRYAALPGARKEITFGFPQPDMHSNVSTSKDRKAGSSCRASSRRTSCANAAPRDSLSPSFRQVEQTNSVWRIVIPFQFADDPQSTPFAYPSRGTPTRSHGVTHAKAELITIPGLATGADSPVAASQPVPHTGAPYAC